MQAQTERTSRRSQIALAVLGFVFAVVIAVQLLGGGSGSSDDPFPLRSDGGPSTATTTTNDLWVPPDDPRNPFLPG